MVRLDKEAKPVMGTLQRRMALLFSTAVVGLAFSAGTASADVPFEVVDPNTYEPCGAVTVEGATVTGGCVLTMDGEWMVADGQSYCVGGFDMHVDSSGAFFTGNTTSYGFYCKHHFSKTQPSVGQIRVPTSGQAVVDMYPLSVVVPSNGKELAFPVADAEFDGEAASLEIQGDDAGCPVPPSMQQYCSTFYPGIDVFFAGVFDSEDSVLIVEQE